MASLYYKIMGYSDIRLLILTILFGPNGVTITEKASTRLRELGPSNKGGTVRSLSPGRPK